MVAVEHQVTDQKARGAYYTPPETAAALVRWAVRDPNEHMLDPSCGDGRFLALHPRSTGVDCDATAVSNATEAAPRGTVECADFFDWADRGHPRVCSRVAALGLAPPTDALAEPDS